QSLTTTGAARSAATASTATRTSADGPWRVMAKGKPLLKASPPSTATDPDAIQTHSHIRPRGFEPPAIRSRIRTRIVAEGANRRQLCAILTDRGSGRVQPVAGFRRVSQGFFYPLSTQLLRDNGARRRAACGGWAWRHDGA